MCGSRFEPAQSRSCESCPLFKGCALVCCPDCGYSTVDPRRSRIVSAGSRLASLFRLSRFYHRSRPDGLTLADVPVGATVDVDNLDRLPVESCHQLQAYGLSPGRSVEIVQQSPVTVVRIEQLDLAFEAEIARAVSVRPARLRSPA